MPPKKRRPENKGLPERWRYRYGSYYYQVPKHLREFWDNKAEFKLGKTLIEAHRTWVKRAEIYEDAETIKQLLERYSIEILPFKSPATYKTELTVTNNLIEWFGHFPIRALRPVHIYKMKDKIGRTSINQANRHISVLSHVYTKAIEWGYTDDHPVKGKVLKFGYVPRDRYVQDWELNAFLSVASDLIKRYTVLKLMTGLRKGDMLSIKIADLKEDGIHVTQNKTGKKLIFIWDEELRQAVADIRALPRKVGSLYLFATRTGQPYIKENKITSGFDSIWDRYMATAIEKTKLVERFTEHDLRAKAASDAEEAHAIENLDHSSPALTKKVYRRKEKVVLPFKIADSDKK